MDARSDLINITQLSEMIGLSVPTIYRHLKEGPPKRYKGKGLDVNKIPQKLIGGKCFFVKHVVSDLLEEL